MGDYGVARALKAKKLKKRFFKKKEKAQVQSQNANQGRCEHAIHRPDNMLGEPDSYDNMIRVIVHEDEKPSLPNDRCPQP